MSVPALPPVAAFARLLPAADPAGTAALAARSLAGGLLPVGVMLATGALVDGVIRDLTGPAHGGTGGPGGPGGLPGLPGLLGAAGGALLALGALLLALQVAVPLLDAGVERLAHRVDVLLRDRLLTAVLTPPTIAHLEDPGLADELAMAGTVGTEKVQTPRALAALAGVAAARLLAVGAAVTLAVFAWWAPLPLIAAWTLSNVSYRQGVERLITSMEAATPGFRRARYLGEMALDGAAAKEVRLFGLGPWLAERLAAHWRAGTEQAWRRNPAQQALFAVSAAALAAAHVGVCALVALAAARGDIGLGEVTVYLQAVMGMAGFGWDPDAHYLVRLGVAPVPHTLRVAEAARGRRFALPGADRPPPGLRHGLELRAVTFGYPGADRPVLRGLDLRVPAGRSLAVVGENGCGKTTLLKLLCRFYDPGEGAVLADGTDLRDLDPAAWQRGIGAVFQDFGRYALPLRDNVAFGSPAHRADEAALARAAERAGLRDVLDGLPGGWDAVLSREFEGGVEPSGGQWQRIALARALLAVHGGARLLLLDEPTSGLDVRAEAAFYDRFLELTRGLTTVVVSHRFATVRRADHIVVLAGGRVSEQGSHAELVAAGGRYAEMFEAQAAPFREAGRA
ncbi:ABC transporter ATP-binding protein [Bailinhaonella thermotolerans]|uniref:ATP-binding cassette domain-containing protein n=1 Tax=Bailinhaonella thermotolerans TaxID=1070861 RepID=A0A3A4BRV5_9ACTN|nr:ATP-binding cassette domain-containing protein [Bailinhaonella thermotolerans]RJL34056.1 ATP-binding cassette domain-containing protein [Bailinhaonella thermotolerans]